MPWYRHKILVVIGAFLLMIALNITLLIQASPIKKTQIIGATFADFHASNFGLDPKEVYIAMLDDLRIRDVRISAYWDKIEREKGVHNFSWLDWQVEEASKRNARIIMAVGRKLPRWPECFLPEWALQLPEEEQNAHLLDYIEVVIERYKDEPSIVMWQVENEPFLPFGNCPDYDRFFVDEELTLVRSLDKRPIITTDSGELSIWVLAAKRGDVFGTTMYRTVWNKHLGYYTYPIPPQFFRVKKTLTEMFVGRKPMMVIELQGEPWAPQSLQTTPLEEQYYTMSPQKFKETFAYAEETGFDTYYTWGVEWWYWLKTQGNSEIWDYMRAKVAETQGS